MRIAFAKRTYEVNKVCDTLFAPHILALPKYNPPPQFANWGTSFPKEAYGALHPVAAVSRGAVLGDIVLAGFRVVIPEFAPGTTTVSGTTLVIPSPSNFNVMLIKVFTVLTEHPDFHNVHLHLMISCTHHYVNTWCVLVFCAVFCYAISYGIYIVMRWCDLWQIQFSSTARDWLLLSRTNWWSPSTSFLKRREYQNLV